MFLNKDLNTLVNKYKINNTSSFRFKSNLQASFYDSKNIQKINYRPFDKRYTYYDIKLQRRPSYESFNHIIKGSIGIVFKRGFDEVNSAPIFVVNSLSDRRGWTRAGMQGAESITPLYFYPETTTQQTLDGKQERVPNLNKEIINKIEKALQLTFTPEKQFPTSLSFNLSAAAERRGTEGEVAFAPIDILDYIYAVLHSPAYREKYKEFLKIDFPRVPYPKNKKTFWQLVKLGGELRQIHLLESETLNKLITSFPVDGNNLVEKIKYETPVTLSKPVPMGSKGDHVKHFGKVWINDTQYFDKVPQVAWEFYIGGYQPAQKWLKDRKARTLNYDDIQHYQKIIVALTETDRLMKEINQIKF